MTLPDTVNRTIASFFAARVIEVPLLKVIDPFTTNCMLRPLGALVALSPSMKLCDTTAFTLLGITQTPLEVNPGALVVPLRVVNQFEIELGFPPRK